MRNRLYLFKIFTLLVLPFLMIFTIFSSLSAAQNVASKPSVLEFSSPMCPTCRQLAEVLPSVEAKYANQVIVKKINTASSDSETAQLVSKYKVTVVPTLVFIDKKGNTVRTTQGCLPKSQLDSYFNELIDR